jgi:N-acetylglucosaminyl-diphospho-decaprenol L-rhamnosyltransferase
VAYGLESLDLSWAVSPLAAAWRLVVVHNDERLGEVALDSLEVVNVWPGRNEGFARAVNRALAHAEGRRLILANPDAGITAEQVAALAEGHANTVLSLPIVDCGGTPNSVVSRYPTPLSLALTVLRVGRLAPRGGKARQLLAQLLGPWGRAHARSLQKGPDETAQLPAGRAGQQGPRWPLSEYWCAGTLVSLDTERLRAVGGLDERYFLYREDIDLCRRLEASFPGMQIELVTGPPAVHKVGGTAVTADDRTRVRWARWASAAIYCADNDGPPWKLLTVITRLVASLLARKPAVRTLDL